MSVNFCICGGHLYRTFSLADKIRSLSCRDCGKSVSMPGEQLTLGRGEPDLLAVKFLEKCLADCTGSTGVLVGMCSELPDLDRLVRVPIKWVSTAVWWKPWTWRSGYYERYASRNECS